jgi:hypothetical protein
MKQESIWLTAASFVLCAVASAAAQDLKTALDVPWHERAKLVAQLSKRVETEGRGIATAEVRTDVLRLLTAENTTSRALFVKGTGVAGVYGEGYGEYYSSLLDLSMSLIQATAGQERTGWLRELAVSAYNPDSAFVDWLIQFGDDSVVALVSATTGAELDIERSNAYCALATLVTATAVGAVKPSRVFIPLSPGAREQAVSKTREGLLRLDRTSREIVRSLKRGPAPEGVALLQEFATSARGRGAFSSYRVGGIGPTLSEEVERAVVEVSAAIAKQKGK